MLDARAMQITTARQTTMTRTTVSKVVTILFSGLQARAQTG